MLLASGAFSPVHLGHLEMMEQARAAAQRAGHRVLGGYLLPDHDSYVSGKQGGAAALDAYFRVDLCQQAVEGSQWLAVCPWGACYARRALNFTTLMERLRLCLAAQGWEEAEPWLVCGADNAGFIRAFAQQAGLIVCVREGGARLSQLRDEPEVRAGHVLLAENRHPHTGESGTPPAGPPRLAAAPSLSRGVYLLRDDLQLSTAGWEGLLPDLEARLNLFRARVMAALQRALGQQIHLKLLELEEQKRLLQRLDARPGVSVVSLDSLLSARYRLQLSRRFHLAERQSRGERLEARPGAPSLPSQLAELPTGPLLLVDDDIASGQSMDYACSLLGEARVQERLPLHQEKPYDVLDLRDLLLGSSGGGLVVELAGPESGRRVARAPYLAPWVNLHTRGRIPLPALPLLAQQLWQANLEFFSRSGLSVQQAEPLLAPLLQLSGFQPEESLQRVCQPASRLDVPANYFP